MTQEKPTNSTGRDSALNMDAVEFRQIGHRLIEQIAEYYESLPGRELTTAMSRSQVRELIGAGSLPEKGVAADKLLNEIAPLLFDHSLHNGHPRFLGYISASGSPLGALADMLSGAVNANLAKWELSPVASEIETQTIRWMAELTGFPSDCGGLMVSGGNSANFHGFVAARKAMAPWDLRKDGVNGKQPQLTAYVSRETHTWIDKAADVCGLGSEAVRWIETDDRQRICLDTLKKQVEEDRRAGCLPFLVVGTAGTVSTGAIDPLRDLAAFCKEQQIWFHVDGAYGAPAASLAESPDDLHALALADSVAVDPHKWLYTPIAAACILTRDPQSLQNAFDFRPDYYHFANDNESGIDYYQHGMQNSRSFRALKVWLSLRRAGLEGCRATIREDISLAQRMHRALAANPDFEACSLNLSIVAFRYVPPDLDAAGAGSANYLNELNEAILSEVQASGRAFVSNAIVDGSYLLRACVVNFRTTAADIDAVIEIIADIGNKQDRRMRPDCLAA